MDVVGLFISADGAHVSIKPLAVGKTVFLQGKPLPLRKGVDDFGLRVILLLDTESDRSLYTVQVIV